MKLILLLFCFHAFQQRAAEIRSNLLPPLPLSQSILSHEYIVDATVYELGDHNLTLLIHKTISGKIKTGKKLRIYWRHVKAINRAKIEQLCLEEGRRYVMILSKKPQARFPHSLNSIWYRFPVVTDSICLHYEVLQQMHFDSTVNIKQRNTFDDPASQFGYKISLSDFQDAVSTLKSSFVYTEYRCLFKLTENATSDDPFKNGLLTYADSMWVQNKCLNHAYQRRDLDYRGSRVKGE